MNNMSLRKLRLYLHQIGMIQILKYFTRVLSMATPAIKVTTTFLELMENYILSCLSEGTPILII